MDCAFLRRSLATQRVTQRGAMNEVADLVGNLCDQNNKAMLSRLFAN
ncbi:hypothetical protein [Mesorhizobium sp. M1348]